MTAVCMAHEVSDLTNKKLLLEMAQTWVDSQSLSGQRKATTTTRVLAHDGAAVINFKHLPPRAGRTARRGGWALPSAATKLISKDEARRMAA